MVICYNTQHLAYQHLHETNNLMRKIMPAIEKHSIQETAIRIFLLIRELERSRSAERLLEIAEDGVIDANEQPAYDQVVDILRSLVKGSLELAVFCDPSD